MIIMCQTITSTSSTNINIVLRHVYESSDTIRKIWNIKSNFSTKYVDGGAVLILDDVTNVNMR